MEQGRLSIINDGAYRWYGGMVVGDGERQSAGMRRWAPGRPPPRRAPGPQYDAARESPARARPALARLAAPHTMLTNCIYY